METVRMIESLTEIVSRSRQNALSEALGNLAERTLLALLTNMSANLDRANGVCETDADADI